MYTQIFQEIGLTPNEAKIYETLLNEGECGVSSISLTSGIHRRNAYDAIDRLVEKGLVFPILSKGDNTYKAASPSKLLEIIRAKENRLSMVLPALEEQYDRNPRKQETFIYRGVEGVKNYLRDILKTGADLYTIGSAGFLFNKKLQNFLVSFRAEEQSLGIKEKHIFNEIDKENIQAWAGIAGVDYKFLPQDKLSNLRINIFGDHVVSITGRDKDDELTLYMVVDDKIADGYRQLFEVLWAGLPADK